MSKQKQEPKSKDAQQRRVSRELDAELEMTFPASDPPESTEPGAGITGPEVLERKPAKDK